MVFPFVFPVTHVFPSTRHSFPRRLIVSFWQLAGLYGGTSSFSRLESHDLLHLSLIWCVNQCILLFFVSTQTLTLDPTCTVRVPAFHLYAAFFFLRSCSYSITYASPSRWMTMPLNGFSSAANPSKYGSSCICTCRREKFYDKKSVRVGHSF